jgi:hypothetical protein
VQADRPSLGNVTAENPAWGNGHVYLIAVRGTMSVFWIHSRGEDPGGLNTTGISGVTPG